MEQLFQAFQTVFSPPPVAPPPSGAGRMILTVGVVIYDNQPTMLSVIGPEPHPFDNYGHRTVFSFHQPTNGDIVAATDLLRQQVITEARRRQIDHIRHLGHIPPD